MAGYAAGAGRHARNEVVMGRGLQIVLAAALIADDRQWRFLVGGG
ncbi:MAG TPA: hypothetical protein VND63_04285 [Rhodanobacteraceae bacterium]|nr:hypothetical protein [Rhodanobacteraceae bacterium]